MSDSDTKLPCGHTEAEHEAMVGQVLEGQGPVSMQALSLFAQGMERSAEVNLDGLFKVLFWLVNSYDKTPEALPPGAKNVDEARQLATSFAMGTFLAMDAHIRQGTSFPDRWLMPATEFAQ